MVSQSSSNKNSINISQQQDLSVMITLYSNSDTIYKHCNIIWLNNKGVGPFFGMTIT